MRRYVEDLLLAIGSKPDAVKDLNMIKPCFGSWRKFNNAGCSVCPFLDGCDSTTHLVDMLDSVEIRLAPVKGYEFGGIEIKPADETNCTFRIEYEKEVK